MKVAIYGQYYQENTLSYIKALFKALEQKPVEIYIEREYAKAINSAHDNIFSNYNTFKELDKSYDLLFTLGGDGTILRAITFVNDFSIPIIGINIGRLGFLATIQKNDIEKAINQIFNKEYRISERSLLSIETTPSNKSLQDFNIALNEIAVSRKNTTSMITVETYLDDEYLTSYWADGLIVSTPTGSTGYSLSCGGPVITPGANSLILTPIAPHNLNARPLVIPDTTEIKLKVTGREKNYLVSLDSRTATLKNETEIIIKKAPNKIKMVELKDESFLITLRKKLLWGEDRRN